MSARSAVAGMVILAVGFTAGAARAVDGVIEINQAKAMAGGVTPADGAGFPVTLTLGGSYRLTSNLDVAAGGQGTPENLDGILISIGSEPREIEIDLNGFAIVGPVTCSFSVNLSCSGNQSGTGKGIVQGSDARVRIHDGTVKGFASQGIQLDSSTGPETRQLRNLDLRWNDTGIVTAYAVLENITVKQNRTRGIYAYASMLSRIVSHENGVDGIYVDDGVLDGCTTSYNGEDGIEAGQGSVIRNCQSFHNLTGYGLRCSSGMPCGYAGNLFRDNTGGEVLNGLAVGSNICGTSLTCP